MAKMFKSKVRRVGTSLGILIPKEILEEEEIEEGEEVEIGGVWKKRKPEEILKWIDKAFGSAKGAKPFERDKADRVDRLDRLYGANRSSKAGK